MVFGRKAAEPPGSPKPSRSEPPRAGTPCGSLARALARVFREGKPEILDLGPLCGESVVYLAARGARVHVEEFDPPLPTPARRPGDPPAEKTPVRLDHPDGCFHLVLIWELMDFVPPDRLAEFGAEVSRITQDGGWAFLLSMAQATDRSEPITRYRLLADDLFLREETTLAPRRRFAHPNREIERALSGFSIQGIHLQRSQMREILAVKSGVGS